MPLNSQAGMNGKTPALTFGIEPPDTATLKAPLACTESRAIAPIRSISSLDRASGVDPTSNVVVMVTGTAVYLQSISAELMCVAVALAGRFFRVVGTVKFS